MIYKKSLTPQQALEKLKHYCGYQERSHYEVREKLYNLGVWKKDHDGIIATLIEENYLNEERFAFAFARGKFRIKNWGRTRIKYELKQKQISDYSIKKALAQITDEEYEKSARKLLHDRFDSLKNEQYLIRKKKTMDYLVYKGYEYPLIATLIKEVTDN